MKQRFLFGTALGCMALLCPFTNATAQKIAIKKMSTDQQIEARSKFSATDFPPLSFAKIKGAPMLTEPKRITTLYGPVEARGMGWAYPEFRDMNGDGKKDLLIGEFGSGLENGYPTGNFIRVYTNKGEEAEPKLSDEFTYLRGDNDQSFGTPLSIFAWCCMGFKPTFVDLDNDGYTDIVAGQYMPGDIIIYKGTKKGFLSGARLPQEGNPQEKKDFLKQDRDDPKSGSYWIYSTVAVADLTGDGLDDLILGGQDFRISKNIGTKSDPKFGLRKPLLLTDGKPITSSMPGGKHGGHINPVLYDWDNDGVLDLLATFSYTGNYSPTLMFYKGVKQKGEYRFQVGIEMITTPDGGKALPGSHPSITITDWNNDGIMDIVMGLAVATRDDQFDAPLSWQWEIETGIYQLNPGYYTEAYKRSVEQSMVRADLIRKKSGLTEKELDEKRYISRQMIYKDAYVKPEYKTLKHVGYVYVFLGKK